MNEPCGKCDQFRKKPFTTVFECKRFNVCLDGRPPMKCRQCVEAEEQKTIKETGTKTTGSKTKKEYIEVK